MDIKKFQSILAQKDIDAAFLTNLWGQDINVKYLLKKDASSSFLFIPKKGNSVLLVSEMDYEHAKQQCSAKHKVLKFTKPFSKQLEKLLAGKKKIGVNFDTMTMRGEKSLKKTSKASFVDISAILSDARKIKDDDEIKKISIACSIADGILRELIDVLPHFRTESEVKNFLIIRTIQNNCSLAFEPLVASGKNAGYAHYSECTGKISKGFMFIDFGIDYEGYKSDITRTVYIGNPSKKETELYKSMLETQKNAVAMAKDGAKASDIDKFVRSEMGTYSRYYTHSLGHGLGLEIHERPVISIYSDEILKENMAVTIEPGIYVPGRFGMRIEDTIIIKKGKPVVLTRFPKDLIVVK